MLTNSEVVELYATHEEEISAIWGRMGESATMRDAVEEWQRRSAPMKRGRVIGWAALGLLAAGLVVAGLLIWLVVAASE